MARANEKNSRKAQRAKKHNEAPELKMSPKAKRELAAILLLVAALIVSLGFFDVAGPVGRAFNTALSALFGVLKFALPLILLIIAGWLAFPEKIPLHRRTVGGSILLALGLAALINTAKFSGQDGELYIEALSSAGGYVGLAFAYPLVALLGLWGALIMEVAILGISIVVISNLSWQEIVTRARYSFILTNRNNYKDENFTEEEEGSDDEDETESDESEQIDEGFGLGENNEEYQTSALATARPRQHHKKVDIPINLLEGRQSKPTSGDIHGRRLIIQKTLENFGILVEMGEISIGPTVTQFTLKPAAGIKLSRITALSNDLALSLAAHPIRIEAPIPGKSLVGIEVPNQTVAIVTLREILESDEFIHRKSNLTICLGKDVSGKAWIADLGKMPHLLVAGATGSGKTVCLNSIVLSLIFQNSPDDLKFMLIDPKRVELPIYNGIPHLLTPAIVELPKIINAFKWAIGEMERRFEILSKSGCRDIASYNERNEEKLPFIVVVVDELADLMVAAAAEIEAAVIRLAQMARAVGIHLIIATQRPSVDVITGLIKANITTRIAFSVASSMDSRTILDGPGAETLVGRGDSLFMTADLSKPKRIQCCYVNDRDIKHVVTYLKERTEEPVEYDEDITEKKTNTAFGISAVDDNDDELYDEARATVIKAGKASASYLQRRLKVGYARAARLLDLLEERGIIGPGEGAKPREILVSAIEDEDGVHVYEEE
ncbi:DNA translocase FtsK [Patescibacteria group bacterium]|nr:DNA translocase FtsK [Patescibacteria group bacterium]MBU1028716.1 DNA translocase FtsK [Patescibacteria group bacterium]MBU1916301.1 DNA translocase FtsK [Patescibacteria group bacterium]